MLKEEKDIIKQLKESNSIYPRFYSEMTLLKEEKEKMNQLMESKFNISKILGTDFLSAYRRAGWGEGEEVAIPHEGTAIMITKEVA